MFTGSGVFGTWFAFSIVNDISKNNLFLRPVSGLLFFFNS